MNFGLAAKKSKKPIEEVNFGMAARRTETRELRGALAMQVRLNLLHTARQVRQLFFALNKNIAGGSSYL